MKGNEKIVVTFSIPKLLPSTTYIKAKPNIMFAKNAPKSNTFVICQITKWGTETLASWKFGIDWVGSSLGDRFMKFITTFIKNQSIEERCTMLTLTNAIAARAIPDIKE